MNSLEEVLNAQETIKRRFDKDAFLIGRKALYAYIPSYRGSTVDTDFVHPASLSEQPKIIESFVTKGVKPDLLLERAYGSTYGWIEEKAPSMVLNIDDETQLFIGTVGPINIEKARYKKVNVGNKSIKILHQGQLAATLMNPYANLASKGYISERFYRGLAISAYLDDLGMIEEAGSIVNEAKDYVDIIRQNTLETINRLGYNDVRILPKIYTKEDYQAKLNSQFNTINNWLNSQNKINSVGNNIYFNYLKGAMNQEEVKIVVKNMLNTYKRQIDRKIL